MRAGPATRAGHGAYAQAANGGTDEQVCWGLGWRGRRGGNGRVEIQSELYCRRWADCVVVASVEKRGGGIYPAVHTLLDCHPIQLMRPYNITCIQIKHYTLPIHRDAIPTAESHLAGLYSSLRRANSSGKEMATLPGGRPLQGFSSNGGGGRSTVANSTLLPRVVEDHVVAIDAEVKQSLMELLLGRHAVVRGGRSGCVWWRASQYRWQGAISTRRETP